MTDATRNANVYLGADIGDYQKQMGTAVQSTNMLSAAVDSLASKLDGLGRRTAKKIAIFSASDLAMMTAMTAQAQALQNQLSTLSSNAAVTGRGMGTVTDGVRQMSRDFGVARSQIAGLVTDISQMGITAQRDMTSFSRVFIQTAAATGGSADTLANSMISLSRQMGTLAGGASQMMKFSDSLVSVSAAAGVSAQGVADFANSIAPFARVAGIGESQVLGLSAAFVQAGNDGYVAANTFNQMLADITRQTQSGGPGLAKYASLVNMTVSQFKHLSGSQQVVSIFKAISDAGTQAVQVLDSMGYDGPRTAKAIQTMAAQAGGLDKLIATATGAYGNGSTQTGAQAAMQNLNEEAQRFVNITQDIGTSIGQYWVAPMNAALGIIDNILAGASKLTGIFSAGGALAGVGGALGMAGSGVMGVASYAALPLAARWLWNTKGAGALRAGFRGGAGRSLSADDAMYTNRAFVARSGQELLDAAGQQIPAAGALENMLYNLGAGTGAYLPKGDGGLPTWQKAAGLPFRAATAYASSTANFYREARVPGYQRPEGTDLSNPATWKKVLAEVQANETVGQRAWNALKAGTKAEIEAAKGAASAIGAVARSGPVSSLLSGLGGMAMSPGMLLGMGGLGLLQLKGATDQHLADLSSRSQDSQFYNQMVPYNDALGQATTNLVSMASSVSAAATGATNLADALNNATHGYLSGKTTNPNTASISTPEQGAAYLRSLGTTDPKVIQAASIDVMRQLGWGQGQKALALFQQNPVGGASPSDVTTLSNNIVGGGGSFMDSIKANTMGKSTDKSDQAAQLALGSIQQRFSDTYTKYGLKAAQQQELGDIQTYVRSVINSGGTDSISQSNRADALRQLATVTGMNLNVDNTDLAYTPGQLGKRQDWWYKTTGTGAAVQKWMTDFATANGLSQTDPYGATKQLSVTQQNVTAAALGKGGFSTSNAALAAAMANPGDANAQMQASLAMQRMAGNNVAGQVAAARARLAKSLGVPVTDPRVVNAITPADFAGANLQSVIGAVPDPSTATFGVLNTGATNAQALVGIQQQFQGTYQTRIGRLASAQSQYTAAMSSDPNAPNADIFRNQATQQYESAKSSYGQFLQSMIQAHTQYAIQMKRSEQDYELQTGYAEQDWYRQRLRTTQDFQKQMRRSLEDTAKTIYNPFTRVQSQYTTDVGNVKANLADQTSRIKQQIAQLRQLKRLGLSQQSIDELQLSDPANAQQVDELVQEMTRLDAQTINKQVAARLQATGGLTQSDLSQSYRRSQQDFATMLSRSQQDYHTMVDRMGAQHALAVQRAKEDLDNLTADYANSFPKMFETAMGLATQNLKGMSSKTIAELKAVQAQFPDLFPNSPTSSAPPLPASPSTHLRPNGQPSAVSNTYIHALNVTTPDAGGVSKAIADKARQTQLRGGRVIF